MKIKIVLAMILSLMVTACGSVAQPQPLVTNTPLPEGAVAIIPTNTPTSIPPTATTEPTLPPTETPTPTEEPTEEATAETAQESAPSDQYSVLASFGSASKGEALFQEVFETSQGPFSCFTCHNVDSELQKIGPGLLNVPEKAKTRIDGYSAAQYLYESILHPGDYLVEGFEQAPLSMPDNYSTLLTDTQVYDLVAYLLTLSE